MKFTPLFITVFCISLLGCNDPNEKLNSIGKKLSEGTELSKSEKCVSDIVVSNIVDPKNIMVYAATFDSMARAFISAKSSGINSCVDQIILDRKNSTSEFGSKNCPSFMHELSYDQLLKMHDRTAQIVDAAKNYEGSAIQKAFGNCI